MAWFVGVLALLAAEASELREVEGDNTLSLEAVCCEVGFEMVSLDMPKSNPVKSEKSTEPEDEGDAGAELPAFSRSARRHA